jgi:transcriptional repressor NrdR
MVTEELKEIDVVAYVRFASVYRDFQDIEEFQAEITRLTELDPNGDSVVEAARRSRTDPKKN